MRFIGIFQPAKHQIKNLLVGSYFDAAEGLLTSVILLIAEFRELNKRHIVSVFKLIQLLMAHLQDEHKSALFHYPMLFAVVLCQPIAETHSLDNPKGQPRSPFGLSEGSKVQATVHIPPPRSTPPARTSRFPIRG